MVSKDNEIITTASDSSDEPKHTKHYNGLTCCCVEGACVHKDILVSQYHWILIGSEMFSGKPQGYSKSHTGVLIGSMSMRCYFDAHFVKTQAHEN